MTPVRRDWSDARQKVEEAGHCARCHRSDVKLEAAHIMGRSYDQPRVEGSKSKVLYVHPDSIWVACSDCHRAYDAKEIGILPFLTLEEQVRAVRDAKSIEGARRRLDAPDYRPAIQRARAEAEL